MPSLLIVALEGGGLSYSDYDIIAALPEGQHPGIAVAENDPPRFGFAWIEDRDPTDPEIVELVESQFGAPDSEGETSLGAKRRYGANLSVAPGQIKRFETYHAFPDAPNNVKFTYAQVAAFLTDKGLL